MLDERSENLKERAEKSSYDKWRLNSKNQTQQGQEEYLKSKYDEYLLATDTNIELPDELKVQLMRDTFRVELGENFINSEINKGDSTFPAFYAIDLI